MEYVVVGVLKNEQLINQINISSLNIRIAREILGCSNYLLEYILDIKKNNIFNTLIVSSPGIRKNNHS